MRSWEAGDDEAGARWRRPRATSSGEARAQGQGETAAPVRGEMAEEEMEV